MNTYVKRLKGYFVTGFIAIFPLLITVLVLKWIAGTVDGYIGPKTIFGQMLQKIGYKFSPWSNITLDYAIGIIILLLGILILGMLLESGARKTLVQLANRTVYQLPLVRAIYQTTDKFMSLIPSSEVDNIKGMQVVFCRFGEGESSAGSLALMPTPEIFKLGDQEYRIVIIPTAPIPVGGAMLFMPNSSIFPTDMSIDTFAGVFMSMGVTATPFSIGGVPYQAIAPTGGAIPVPANKTV